MNTEKMFETMRNIKAAGIKNIWASYDFNCIQVPIEGTTEEKIEILRKIPNVKNIVKRSSNGTYNIYLSE